MAKKVRSSKLLLINATQGREHLRDVSLVDEKNRKGEDLLKASKKRRGSRDANFEKEMYWALDMMKSGYIETDLVTTLTEKINSNTGKPYSIIIAKKIVSVAKALLDIYYRQILYQGEKLHVQRYNRTIVELMNKNYSEFDDKPFFQRRKQIKDLLTVLKAMKQKEVLLGMHRITFKTVVNNQLNIYKKEQQEQTKKIVKKTFNIDKLDFDEKVELLSLIEKTKIQEEETMGIILREVKKEVEEEVVEDVEYEEVVNLDKMESYKKKDYSQKSTTLEKLQKKLIEKSKNK